MSTPEKVPFGVDSRKYWIDYLRAIAAFGIVSVHISVYYYSRYGKIDLNDWWLANVLNAPFRFVPTLFIMISGCLLLGNNISVGKFYTKRAMRLLPSILFWNAFYLCFRFCTETDMSDPTWLVRAGGHAMVTGRATAHLWYLSMLLGLMMLAPYLNMFVTGAKPTEKETLILVLVLFILICIAQASLITGTLKEYNIEWHVYTVLAIPYFLMGHYIDKHHEKIGISNMGILVVILSIVSAVLVFNYVVADRFGIAQDDFVFDMSGPLMFVVTPMLFLLFRKNANIFKESKIIVAISDATFGIYLVHGFCIYICVRILKLNLINMDVGYLPFLISLVTATSFVTIHFFRKIKIFRALC